MLAAVSLMNAASIDTISAPFDQPAQINQVLERNQIFIDTLIATNTP